MKTTRSFLIALVGLALVSSLFVQEDAQPLTMNQASLISFADEPTYNSDVNTIVKDESVILPGIKVDDEYMPLIQLPEVKIEDELNRDKLYPAVKVDGQYIPHMELQEVNIKAN